MADLVVIVPSRGRPAAARALAETFAATCTADTELTFAVDDDDPTLAEYSAVARECQSTAAKVSVGVVENPRNMVHALNQASIAFVEVLQPTPFAIGFMGDDHRPRTVGWDHLYLQSLRVSGTGIVFGDDKLQSQNLPTQCAMTADIIRVLGYMAPPKLRHMYVDNFWLALGNAAECIRYLPDVVVEHLHPVAGKAEWDEGYRRVNDPAMFSRDSDAFAGYVRDSMQDAADKVRALRTSAMVK